MKQYIWNNFNTINDFFKLTFFDDSSYKIHTIYITTSTYLKSQQIDIPPAI